jgi:hypothetical protein
MKPIINMRIYKLSFLIVTIALSLSSCNQKEADFQDPLITNRDITVC